MAINSSLSHYFLLIVVFIFLIFTPSKKVDAISLNDRYEFGCAYLASKSKIYCTGGVLGANAFGNLTYSLDLKPLSAGGINTTLGRINTLWEIVKPINSDYIVEKRKSAGFASVNSIMYLMGGFSTGNTKLVNQTVSFNMETEIWETLPGYVGYGDEVKQIYRPSIASSPSSSKIYFYGGRTELPIGNTYEFTDLPMQTPSNFTSTVGGTVDTRVIGLGYTQSTIYDVNSKSWSLASPQQKPLTTDSFINRETIYDTNNDIIYYIGGNNTSSEDNYEKSILERLNYAITFDIKTGAWNSINFDGDVRDPRAGASLTFLSNSRQAILYGGSRGDISDTITVLEDTCYILNLDAKLWNKCKTDQPPPNVKALRSHHSAVLVDTSLFILFGTSFGENLRDTLILDIKNLDSIRFVNSYPYTEQNLLVANEAQAADKASLSLGAMIGISVSCAVIVVAIVGFVMYFKRRKADRNSASLEDKEDQNNDNLQYSNNEVYTEWDYIDKHFGNSNNEHEAPFSHPLFPAQYQNKKTLLSTPDVSQQFTPHTNLQSDTNISTDYINNSIVGLQSSSVQSSTVPASNIAPLNEENTLEYRESRDTFTTPSPTNIIVLQKPDIGNRSN